MKKTETKFNNSSELQRRWKLPRGLEIIYEDDDIIVVDKPAGLLTVKTATEKTKTAQYILTDYVRKGNYKSRKQIFVVHRLDQWTSGVLIFAKSQDVKDKLQEQWDKTEKKYLAVVHGHLKEKGGVISSYLAENKQFVVYSTKDPSKGKLSHTAYKVVKESRQFSLLEINLLTGRKNQIRVHLADICHPIVGDRKYGKENDGFNRLALHAKSITFLHPVSGKQMMFESKVPAYYREILRLKI
ncbi:MAG: Ribosomal large subunit pseudouridine synthase D [Planctomycetes bacterium ADurb.Bin401]|nr:MAG: Ribosomal large subunit pseudouridine synthase D [Planctomycetes bacterium ADurb.Bin401]